MGVKRGWRSQGKIFLGTREQRCVQRDMWITCLHKLGGDTANPSMLGFHTQVRERKHLKFKDKWAVRE